MVKEMVSRKFNLAVLILAFSLMSCEHTTEPPGQFAEVRVELEIVPNSAVPSAWDATFYQKDTNWGWDNFFNTKAADSLANFLKRSNIAITDFWFPQEPSICGAPIRVGSEVIVKLEQPDPSIYQIGFVPATGFDIICVRTWRHYKFIRIVRG
jgi:hypothetical protein